MLIARSLTVQLLAARERRWRLLQMIAEDPTIGRPQMIAEMSPLLPGLTPHDQAGVLAAVLAELADHGLIEPNLSCWRATPRGLAVVRRRREGG